MHCESSVPRRNYHEEDIAVKEAPDGNVSHPRILNETMPSKSREQDRGSDHSLGEKNATRGIKQRQVSASASHFLSLQLRSCQCLWNQISTQRYLPSVLWSHRTYFCIFQRKEAYNFANISPIYLLVTFSWLPMLQKSHCQHLSWNFYKTLSGSTSRNICESSFLSLSRSLSENKFWQERSVGR